MISGEAFIEGQVLCVHKPYRWTSFDLVKKIRIRLQNALGIKKLKVGHAGTLDPLATGVMLVCTGKATKKVELLQAGIKEYIASVKIGETTPSFDLETEIDHSYPFEHVNLELIRKILPQFIGEIHQVPPEYSAVKIDGKRAYTYARKGEKVKMRSKILAIDEIEIIAYNQQVLKLRIVCSKGTYIRALARDIGKALNSGAHLIALQRTRVGDFSLKDALSLEEFEKIAEKLEQNSKPFV